MSKKRRENQEQRKPLELGTLHYLAGAGVVIVSAVIAIVLFSVFVGTDFGEKGPSADDIPQLGAETPIEPSAAAEVLSNKTWDDMSQDERDLVKAETNRVFDDGHFRASSTRVLALDVIKEGGVTKIGRLYQFLKDPLPNRVYAEKLTFYCPRDDGFTDLHAYFDDGVTVQALEPQVQNSRALPWGIVLSAVDWTTATDLGFDEVDGRRVHGFRFAFTSVFEGEARTSNSDYWFDVENARLLAREPYTPDEDSSVSRYTLRWRSLPPLRLPDDQERPGCVGDLYAEFGG